MDLMKRMLFLFFCFIYSSMLGKSFPYGESVFIQSCRLLLSIFIKEPEEDEENDDDDDDVE